MTCDQVMRELKKLGTAQNVNIYRRHGAGGNTFGVSFANLGVLKKKIKVDHDLSLRLWGTGNADAQSLATMIVDPQELTATVANKWVNGISYYLLADLLSGVIAKTKFAVPKMDQWMKSKKEFVRQCGYATLSSVARIDGLLTDTQCKKYLRTIESEVHGSPNRARHSMSMAIAAIGIFRPSLAKDAIATAQRVGKVDVDHGETGCKTPDAASYIEKALKRKK